MLNLLKLGLISSIDSVYRQGDDALKNFAEIELSPFPLFGPLKNSLKYRTTSITVPGFTMGTYDVHWKAQKFSKPSGKDETVKEFTTEFRVDKYYTTYKALLAWWSYICNPDSGALSEDVGAITGVSLIRTDILVKTIDTQGVTTNDGFKFERCWIKSLGDLSYDVTSGEPLTCSITWNFVKMLPMF